MKTWLPLLAALAMPAAAQTTFTVNSTADPGDGACDAVECTLREAITAANAAPGTDDIHFSIPGGGVHTIRPLSSLPSPVGPVTIDGYTQPGASANTLAVGNDAVLRIELDGSLLSRAIQFGGTGVVLRGLVINRGGEGIRVEGEGSHVIAGNFIGIDPTGTLDLGNGTGILIFRSGNNRVGGPTPADRNVISGNNNEGISLSDASNNTIQGNYIGTDADGEADLGNGTDGVSLGSVFGGTNANLIGGTAPGAGNVISGNGGSGVHITGDHDNTIQGNLIGTNAAGTAAIPNTTGIGAGGNPGVYNVLIGGTEPGAGNVISGNAGRGINFGDTHEGRMTIQGNLIGVGLDGTTPLGNGEAGIHIGFFTGGFFGGGPTTVGGPEPGAANVIAYNGQNGIKVICCEGRPSTFSHNAVFANGLDGIDIGTAENDAGDADGGTNRQQNFPDIVAAGLTGAGPFAARYRVDTDPANAAYPLRVEFFRAEGREGAAFLGADEYTEADYDGCGSPPCEKTALFEPAAPVTDADSVVATATDADGNTSEFTMLPGAVVANEPGEGAPPSAFALHEPFPNPFTRTTTLLYDVAQAGHVRVVAYDLLGREVALLVDREQPAGRYEALLDAWGLPAGLYVVRATSGAFTSARRVTLVR